MRSYQQLHVRGKTRWQMTKDLDFVGIFLYVSGCILFLIGLSWGGVQYPWDSAQTLCTLLIGFGLMVSFVVYGESQKLFSSNDSSIDINHRGLFLQGSAPHAAEDVQEHRV